MNELEEKRAAARKLVHEVRELEHRDSCAELWPAWKGRKGSYWKFRNSYSCPKTESDYWWKYRKITEITPDGKMDTLEFQIDVEGKLTVHEEKGCSWLYRSVDWISSTKAEWRKAALKAKTIMERLS